MMADVHVNTWIPFINRTRDKTVYESMLGRPMHYVAYLDGDKEGLNAAEAASKETDKHDIEVRQSLHLN